MTLWLSATGSRRAGGQKPLQPRRAGAVSQPSGRAAQGNVLIIEDDAEIAGLIKLHLEDLPARVTTVADGCEGLLEARAARYDLIVLDLRLPGCDGLEICQALRAERVLTPILIVSAKGADVDRIVGLQLGADDFLPKPFNVAELAARAKALLRRSEYARSGAAAKPSSAILRAGDVSIDPSTRTVKVGPREVDLTAKEFDLLHLLARQPGRVLSRTQILEALWRSPYEGYEHNVNCHINRLRLKIEHDPHKPRYLITVWGVGYKFVG